MSTLGLLCLLLGCLSCGCYARMLDLTHYYDDHVIKHPFHKKPWVYNFVKGEFLSSRGDTIWWEANDFSTAEHMGTHIDAPVHASPGKRTLDQIPLSDLIAPLIVIDTQEQAKQDRDYALTIDDVTDFEAMYGRIPDGAAVFMYNGWDYYWFDNNEEMFLGMDEKGVLHHPGFHADTVEWLHLNRNIKGIGIDCVSFDIGPSTDFEAHTTLFSNDLWGMENVAYLGKVPPTGAMVQITPMNIKLASGAPSRVVAFWGDDFIGRLDSGATTTTTRLVSALCAAILVTWVMWWVRQE